MTESPNARWERFKKYHVHCPEIGLSLDVSRMQFDEAFLARMEPRVQQALDEMKDLERGGIANADEKRMVGHYWLRAPQLAPSREITDAIESTLVKIERFAAAVAEGKIRGSEGKFANLLVVGIGGSALGPQFVSRALFNPRDNGLTLFFIDNTDPDGIDLVLAQLGEALSVTLCLVISKSGGTKETRNGMLEVKERYRKEGLKFERHVVAVTGEGSELDLLAKSEGWLERFPMWDWVGGRTSELSAVGLLPAALQGVNIRELLRGAAACDHVTREKESLRNPAAVMALMWFASGNGKGEKDMVILPYKDRLELFSRYLQQLIMESLGKEKDRSGKVVNQGLAVYGNKGSTDQHAYVQQLRDGVNNFFATFINVLKDRQGASMEVDPKVATGDYLNGFYLGTREALHENGRQSLTLTISDVSAFQVGALIALFERVVGLYASFININAYHQPGVEAGKRAASKVLRLQNAILDCLKGHRGQTLSAEELAAKIGGDCDPEMVFLVCEHLAGTRTSIRRKAGETYCSSTYRFE